MYEDIIKSTVAYEELVKDTVNATISQAYMFVSPDTVLMNELADMFLYKAISSNDGEDKARKLKSRNIADVKYFPASEGAVKVEDIDFITENAMTTPLELKRKYYVITGAQTMTIQAQNKLLKILEEPPSVVGFILKTTSKNMMLSTVLSRCRLIEPPLLTKAEVSLSKRLNDSDCKDKRLAVSLSDGNLTLLEGLLTDPNYFTVFDFAFKMLENMTHSSMAVRYIGFINDRKEYFDWLLSCLDIILMDIMKCGYGNETRLPDSFLPRLGALREGFRPEAIAEIMSETARLRLRRKFYGNFNSIVDEMLLKMLEVKAKWQKL